jgi:hypothetical protein
MLAFGNISNARPHPQASRWEWIVAALLALCVIGYIWTLQ